MIQDAKRVSMCEEAVAEAAYFDCATVKNSQHGAEVKNSQQTARVNVCESRASQRCKIQRS